MGAECGQLQRGDQRVRESPAVGAGHTLVEGHVALSVRFMGHLIGVALALTAASGVVAYSEQTLWIALMTWAGITLLFTMLVSLLAVIARNVILAGVDVAEEVDQQHNLGVAAIEAAIYISIGLFFTALFA